MSVLTDLSDALAERVASVAPHLAAVRGRRVVGTAIAWSEHELLTAAHLVGGLDAVGVRLPDGTDVRATVVGRDPATDLALLQVEATLTPIPRTGARAARTGELAVVVGRPWGELQATLGLVRATGGAWRTPLGASLEHRVVVDAALPPGFSGGPLLAADGTLLGLNTAGVLRTGTTIPTVALERLVPALATGRPVRRGHLGVSVLAARVEVDGATRDGLLVRDVEDDGPARKAGVAVGDVILALGGHEVDSAEALLHALSVLGDGADTTLDLLRGGVRTALTVTLGGAVAATERRAGCCK